MSYESTTRAYRKRLRAEQEAATRERIAAAAMELHGTIGPAQTTISGVAKRAGVQRATVYRHFSDEEALFAACSAHWYSLHPPPDPGDWASVAEPQERLRAALAATYGWYASDVRMFENVIRDAPVVPAMAAPVAARMERMALAVDSLMRGRGVRGARRARVAAAIGHAMSFPTWHSLVVDGGLSDDEAIAMMTAMVASA